MRLTKIIAADLVGLIGLLFFLNNLFNLDTAYAVVSYVIAGTDQPYYKIIGPVISAGWLTWLALFTIMAGELAVGVLGFMGALKMFKNISAPAADFQTAKSKAIVGAFIGIVVWYGFFVIIGESYFNMWQTETGLGSVAGAFRYGTISAVLMFYIGLPDE